MGATEFALPLFPLQTVLFPRGRLSLKVFEARYVDLIGRCMRSDGQFGVVALRSGAEVQGAASPAVDFESAGVTARVADVDAAAPGILHVHLVGVQRFECHDARQVQLGLWLAQATLVNDDDATPPDPSHAGAVEALRKLHRSAHARSAANEEGNPYDDAGWVANRWCEVLPISLVARQSLLMMRDPLARLALVDRFLRDHGIIGR